MVHCCSSDFLLAKHFLFSLSQSHGCGGYHRFSLSSFSTKNGKRSANYSKDLLYIWTNTRQRNIEALSHDVCAWEEHLRKNLFVSTVRDIRWGEGSQSIFIQRHLLKSCFHKLTKKLLIQLSTSNLLFGKWSSKGSCCGTKYNGNAVVLRLLFLYHSV